METLSEILLTLSRDHRKGLQWFIDHANTEQPWTPSVGSVLLVTKAKGIYKPAWMDYALSVRQVLNSTYPDRDPVIRPDGTWIYQYFQEGNDPEARDEIFTNRSLMACWRDRVPVGVMRQTRGKPNVRYHVLGAALVAGWEDGYFYFEGFSPAGENRGRGSQAEIEIMSREIELDVLESNTFEPESLIDARQRIVASIFRRQGQQQFRQLLLHAYDGKCAVSNCGVPEVLEAAHIVPYIGPETNLISNGLLLRADIHILFDVGKIAVDAETMKLIVSPDLIGTSYEEFNDQQLTLPTDRDKWPSVDALNYIESGQGFKQTPF